MPRTKRTKCLSGTVQSSTADHGPAKVSELRSRHKPILIQHQIPVGDVRDARIRPRTRDDRLSGHLLSQPIPSRFCCTNRFLERRLMNIIRSPLIAQEKLWKLVGRRVEVEVAVELSDPDRVRMTMDYGLQKLDVGAQWLVLHQ
jgi:hypothetical protein